MNDDALRTAFAGKTVLVTGGTGLIGIPLVERLLTVGARPVVASLDAYWPFGDGIERRRGDLCDPAFCAEAMAGVSDVFHLAGIKGGIGVGHAKASSFLVGNVLLNLHVMEAARKAQVDRFLYASSICIYPPAEVFQEENAYTGLPHPSDRFGGVAKMLGEMQIEAYRLQYGLENFLTIRPCNTYGPHDNFDPASALIIPALIHRLFSGENPLTVWGDGSAVRDFVYADDVADMMLAMMAQNKPGPYNCGSGQGVSIKDVVESLRAEAEPILGQPVAIEWDTSKRTGEAYRVTSIEKATRELDWAPRVDLRTGLRHTLAWYAEQQGRLPQRHSILTQE